MEDRLSQPHKETGEHLANLRRKTWRDPIALVATGFGIGWFPVFPGTIASLIAVVIWFFLFSILNPLIQLAVIFLVGCLTFTILWRTVRRYGEHDFSPIVIDEFLGMWIACFLIPQSWWAFLLCFVMFRVLDIMKPWPISMIEHSRQHAWKIMFDDVLAGILACGVSHGLLYSWSVIN